MTSVRFEHISKHFGAQKALDDINFMIQEGELFFLLGPSGCGKSTLLRIVAGLHGPTSGRIFFGDRDVTNDPTETRNAVMCFQSYALWPHMTARQNIRFGLEIRKVTKSEADRRVEEAVDLVQLGQFADKKPNEMSGGQQQRVALARALVVKPSCLLLDEPLSNLDAKLRLEMRGEIRRICRASGLTAIYVTHDQKEALSIADRMAVLNRGLIEQIGRPQDLYLRPGNRFVANFMGETNFIDGVITQMTSDRAEIKTGIGTLVSTVFPATVKVGEKVTVSVRPETISVGTTGAPAINSFDGAIHDTVYLGEVAQHLVSIGSDKTQLRVFELNPRFVARDDEVAQAKVWFDPGDVVVLND
ncbi:MAG: ABC transporter ATP-binding protein [Burkholderiales bacterium]|nr:ABC transporter ATP-binding protein [Phycisphaerae bacterium]